jgi:hypothetical protein
VGRSYTQDLEVRAPSVEDRSTPGPRSCSSGDQ